jgi:predicted DCC family thiol-disulfide oxidoreductase YuxK
MTTVVVYDGSCGLCIRSVRLIRRLDWLHALEYLDAQDREQVHARYPQLDQRAILGQMHLVAPDQRVHVGYQGIRCLLGDLPLVAWLYPLSFLPGITWLGPRVYRWIAAHRYQISGVFGHPAECTGGACRTHRPVQADEKAGSHARHKPRPQEEQKLPAANARQTSWEPSATRKGPRALSRRSQD